MQGKGKKKRSVDFELNFDGIKLISCYDLVNYFHRRALTDLLFLRGFAQKSIVRIHPEREDEGKGRGGREGGKVDPSQGRFIRPQERAIEVTILNAVHSSGLY